LKDFPETSRAAEVRYYIVKSAFEYAENSIVERQIERYQKVVEEAKLFIRKYSNSEYTNEVKTILKKAELKLKTIEKDDRYKIKSTVY
jgi:outer membrane protein assembly factor BamD